MSLIRKNRLHPEKPGKDIDSRKYIESLIRDWGITVKEIKKENTLATVLKENFPMQNLFLWNSSTMNTSIGNTGRF